MAAYILGPYWCICVAVFGSSTATSTCTMEYFNEASVLYMFLKLYVRGMKDIRLLHCSAVYCRTVQHTDTNKDLIYMQPHHQPRGLVVRVSDY